MKILLLSFFMLCYSSDPECVVRVAFHNTAQELQLNAHVADDCTYVHGYTVTLHNVIGRPVLGVSFLAPELDSQRIDISRLPEGMYFLEVEAHGREGEDCGVTYRMAINRKRV